MRRRCCRFFVVRALLRMRYKGLGTRARTRNGYLAHSARSGCRPYFACLTARGWHGSHTRRSGLTGASQATVHYVRPTVGYARVPDNRAVAVPGKVQSAATRTTSPLFRRRQYYSLARRDPFLVMSFSAKLGCCAKNSPKPCRKRPIRAGSLRLHRRTPAPKHSGD